METEALLDYQGRAGDHFHCTVEPSPGHIRCRFSLKISPKFEPEKIRSKPKKGQFMNFSQGHSGTKVRDVNRACFPKEKHQNSQKWAKFMNFSFWSFLWFGLPGRLLKKRKIAEEMRNLQLLNIRSLKNYQCSIEGRKFHENLALVVVIISGNSLVSYKEIIASTGFYRHCAPDPVSTSSGNK